MWSVLEYQSAEAAEATSAGAPTVGPMTRDAPPGWLEPREGPTPLLFILVPVAAGLVTLAVGTALLALVPPPPTAHLYGLIAGITPLLLIALVVETHGSPITFDRTPPWEVTEQGTATPEYDQVTQEVVEAWSDLLSVCWPMILLYICIGEGTALYAAGWNVSNRIVLPLSVGPLLALAGLFLYLAVGVFVRRLAPRATVPEPSRAEDGVGT